MSYVRIWLHCVWTTKNRIPYLKDEIRDKVISHILENAKAKDMYIDCLNGHQEHLHALISLGRQQNISDVMQKIKGESSFWINKNKLTRLKFEWQDDFYSVSIGLPQLHNLREYIRNQPEHHKKVGWLEEIRKMAEKYGFQDVWD